jgi:hypothetical protein
MLLVFAIFFVVIMIVQDKINTAASPAFENVSAGSSIGITTVSSIFNNTLNYMYLAVFFALIIGTFIMAYMTPTHPIFYLLAIILFIGLMLVSVVISNTWQVFSTANADIVTQVGHLSFADYILKNLPLVSIVIGVLVAIVLFARSNNQGNIGGGFQ